MNENVLISIIIPVYNTEKYLRRCITSIQRQNYRNLEILLVDDGSIDESPRICDDCANDDERIKVIHKKNSGVSSARNVGIHEAKGKYLLFVDSDDFVDEEYCSTMLSAAEKDKETFVLCGFQLYSDCPGQKICYSKEEKISVTNKQDIIKLLDQWLINSPCNKLYEREILIKNEIFMPENISLGEDLLFNIEYLDIMPSNSITIINKSLYNYYLQNENTLSSKYNPEQIDVMRAIIKRLYEYCVRWNVQDMRGYYAISLRYLENVMSNNMEKGNRTSVVKKIFNNSKLMKSQEYQMLLKHSQDYFSPIRRMICKCGNYSLLYLFFEVCKIWFPIKEHLYIHYKKPIVKKWEILWKKNGQQL